jgi:nicotinamidase-related amidase
MDNVFSRTMDANNCILLLVDYQDRMFDGIESHNCRDIKNNVIALAKSAQALGISAVLTTIDARANGLFLTRGCRDLPPCSTD